MKNKLLIITLFTAITFQICACSKKNDTPKKIPSEETVIDTSNASETDTHNETKTIPLAEIQKQAQNFQSPYQNLDFSNATITIPDVSEVYDLTFPTSADSFDRQVEKFSENIRKYKGLDENTDLSQYMTVMYWDIPKNDRLTIPLNEATDQQKKEAQYLGYNDGTCSELVVFSNFMLEMGDYSVPVKLTGDDTDYSKDAYGYRGYDLGTLVKRYHLPKDDLTGIHYHLSDGDVAINDAIAYVEKHLKEDYYFAGSKHLDYHVFGVTVRKLAEDIYYYEFDVGTSYKGVSLNRDDCTNVSPKTEEENKDSLQPEPFGTNHLATMFQKDRLGFIWSCCQNFESVTVNQTYQTLLSLEEACRLLSDYISEHKTFSVDSVELIYQTAFTYESEEKASWGYIQSVHANPAYHFTVEKTGLSEYNHLYFDVDAVNGSVTAMSR